LQLTFRSGELPGQDAQSGERDEDAWSRRDEHHQACGRDGAANAADDSFARGIRDAAAIA
jgi:hypothetical protein